MVELVVSSFADPVLGKREVLEYKEKNDEKMFIVMRRTTKYGDIRKVMPKNWHKHFDYAKDAVVVQVREFKSRRDCLHLTRSLMGENNETLQRRRYAINLDALKRMKPRRSGAYRVKSLGPILIDKELM